MNLLVDAASVGLERSGWQTHVQVLRAIRHARAERSQADRMAIEAGDDSSLRVRFERDVTALAETVDGAARRPLFVSAVRKPGDDLRYGGVLD
jgi:hypothetical protein